MTKIVKIVVFGALFALVFVVVRTGFNALSATATSAGKIPWEGIGITIGLVVLGVACFKLYKKFRSDNPNFKLGDFLTSMPAKAALGVVALTVVLYWAAPEVYQKWIGSNKGHFAALLIGAVAAVILVKTESVILQWVAGIVLAVSISPLILSTTIGQKAANVYNNVVDEEGYVETESRKERLVGFSGVKSIEIDTRPWQVGGLGENGCIGLRYSSGMADDNPLFEVKCFGGEEIDEEKWPWAVKIPKVNEALRCPSKPTARGEKEYRKVPDLPRAECDKLFASKTRVEVANVGTATQKVRVYAKIP